MDVAPMVWRRLLVPASYTLEELHGVVQVAMGWEGIHLYEFHIRDGHYGSFDLCVSSPRQPLNVFRLRKGAKFHYDYDMGSFWRHGIRLENRLAPTAGQFYPLCLDGAQACPPEGCGGPEGYVAARDEAMGFGAMDDLAMLADLARDIATGDYIGPPDDSEARQELGDALERTQARAPFLATTFSPDAVNARFRQDEHLRLMHQQLW